MKREQNLKNSTEQALTIPVVSSRFDFEINNLNDISRNVPTFKRHGRDVTPHWLIRLKTEFNWKSKYGFTLAYKSGYFFWIKRCPLLNGY